MAEERQQNEEEVSEEGEASAGGGNKKLLIVAIAAVLVLLLGGGAAFFLLSGDEAAESEEMAAEDVLKPAQYYPLGEKFVVNVDDNGRQRFLQTSITVMAREDKVIDGVKLHLPLIRSRVTMLLGAESFAELRTAEGRETLQQKVLETIQQVMKEEQVLLGQTDEQGNTTALAGVEQVLFTEFVLQ